MYFFVFMRQPGLAENARHYLESNNLAFHMAGQGALVAIMLISLSQPLLATFGMAPSRDNRVQA